MKTTFFFQLLINLFFAIIFLFIGGCLALYPLTKSYYEPLFELITATPWLLPLVGISLIFIAYSIASWTTPLLRKGHFEMIEGKAKIWVEEGVIQKIIQEFLRNKFPKETLSCKVSFAKNRLHILTELPNGVSPKELENELRDALQGQLGYVGNISFSSCAS